MNRIMGLDVGNKTIGVALSDPLLITAQGFKTIKRESNKKDIAAIESIINEYNVNKIVIGFPKNMNNTIGPQGEKVLSFVNKLKNKINIEIVLEDERLTTRSLKNLN